MSYKILTLYQFSTNFSQIIQLSIVQGQMTEDFYAQIKTLNLVMKPKNHSSILLKIGWIAFLCLLAALTLLLSSMRA